MAQTKTKRAKPAKKSRASSSAKSSTAKPRAARTTSKAKAKKATRKPAQGKPAHSNGNSSSHVVGDGAKAVRDAVGSAGHVVGNAGKEAGHAVSKARIPLLAGGAAVVGTVGGIALGASRSGDKMLGVKLPKPKRVKLRSKDLSRVAKEVGRFGENVGELTSELKHAREGLANGEGKHNSPIEVLLNGLTSRR
jgi:hypothetical protein